MWVGLLISYATNANFATSVFAVFCGTFCRILRQPISRKSRTFASNFKAR